MYIYKTKQIKFDHNTKHTTSITKPREKKYTNHHKTTNKGLEPINPIKNKNKNYNPCNNTYHKIHKSN